MLRGFLVVSLLVIQSFPYATPSSLLCGRTKEVEVGGAGGAGAALALTLARPPGVSAPCQLRLIAPDAAAFTVRLIDVKVKVAIGAKRRQSRRHVLSSFIRFIALAQSLFDYQNVWVNASES
ncbi:unnamed protein product [Colias eurytheme]|nr:unnamed protein product [Colias eurytheme]